MEGYTLLKGHSNWNTKMDKRRLRQEAKQQLGVNGNLNLETTWLDLRADWEMELTGCGY